MHARAVEVFNLLCNGKTVIGCEYEKAGMSYKEYGPVIMCSGGFGADFSSSPRCQQLRTNELCRWVAFANMGIIIYHLTMA